jgi:REP element-mobilizing transposase RayT
MSDGRDNLPRMSRTFAPRHPQLALELPQRGGKRRRGAGRRPKGARAGVSHHGRPRVSRHHPVHVTLRVREHVWNLRSRRCFRLIEAALASSRARGLVRVVHVSVQGNHVHLIAEADDALALARGMKGLEVRVARALNRLMSRRGAVFADRYHAHVLRSRPEVRRAIAYLVGNHASHMARIAARAAIGDVDPFSSASPAVRAVLSVPVSWLLRNGSSAPGQRG